MLGVLWISTLCWLASNLLLGVCEVFLVGWFLDCLVGCLWIVLLGVGEISFVGCLCFVGRGWCFWDFVFFCCCCGTSYYTQALKGREVLLKK